MTVVNVQPFVPSVKILSEVKTNQPVADSNKTEDESSGKAAPTQVVSIVKKPVLKEREPVARIRKQEEVATKARTFADRKPQERADNTVKSKAAAAKTVPKERALGKSVAIKQTVGKVVLRRDRQREPMHMNSWCGEVVSFSS